MARAKDTLTAIRHKKKNRWRSRLAIFLGMMILSAVLIVVLANYERLWVKKFDIRGNRLVSSAEIEAVLSKHVAAAGWLFFPRQSILFYPWISLVRELENSFLPLAKVNVRLAGIDRVLINVHERTPLFLWCDQFIATKSLPHCFFVDSTGLAFAAAPIFSGRTFFLLTSGDQSPTLGAKPLLAEDIDSVLTFKQVVPEVLGAAGVALEVGELIAEGGNDFSYVLVDPKTLTRRWRIVFHLPSDISVLAENLLSALTAEALTRKTATGALLEYVDLRFQQKVFYRFRE